MKFFLLTYFISFSYFISVAQSDNDKLFYDFLVNHPSEDCLYEMDSASVKELQKANIVYVNNHRVSLERKSDQTITIDPFGLCNEYRSISMHYHIIDSVEHMFVYRRYAEARKEYGELQLYSKIDGQWQFGQEIQLDWRNFFSISNEEIDRLRNLNQYPTYLVQFKREGIEFSIPWEIYSFDQGSEINGYVKGNGNQPITLSYSNVIP